MKKKKKEEGKGKKRRRKERKKKSGITVLLISTAYKKKREKKKRETFQFHSHSKQGNMTNAAKLLTCETDILTPCHTNLSSGESLKN